MPHQIVTSNLDIKIIVMQSDGFASDFYFARRGDVEIIKYPEPDDWSYTKEPSPSVELVDTLFLEGSPVRNSHIYLRKQPGLLLAEWVFLPTGDAPILQAKQTLPELMKVVRATFNWHANQGKKFKCTSSIGFQQLECLFKWKLWNDPSRWPTENCIDTRWME